MSYVPPQKRAAKLATTLDTKPKLETKLKKEEFPDLGTKPLAESPLAEPPVASKMNFASLFKNAIKKKNRVKKLKWGTILLTKKGVIDSLTPEEREAEEKWKDETYQENQLRKAHERLLKDQNLRREYDPRYESPEEWSESSSEEEEEEEDEDFTEDYEEEDEFEPEI